MYVLFVPLERIYVYGTKCCNLHLRVSIREAWEAQLAADLTFWLHPPGIWLSIRTELTNAYHGDNSLSLDTCPFLVSVNTKRQPRL